jgi:hypothetical protein
VILDDRFKLRRGTAANLATVNEVPLEGEIVYETDQGLADGKYKVKIGDGSTHYNDLPYVQLGGGVEAIAPGSHISVDTTDPKNPVVAVSGTFTGSGYPEGPSFPASPALNDKFYRNDLNLLCYYDGTRWLTVQEYQLAGVQTDATSGLSLVLRWPVRSDEQLYLTRWAVATFAVSVSATNVALAARNAANSSTTLSSFSTSGDPANNWVNHDQPINSVVPSGSKEIQQNLSSGGVAYAPASLCYRLVIT